MILKTRHNQTDIVRLHAKPRGRLLVITGARQTGKSTLAHMAFPEYPLLDFDSPREREVYERWSPAQWISRYPFAVLDEAQKLPAIFETIKACHDRAPHVRYILLGSSQILLLRNVRETLAGRVALRELFPFSLPELVATAGQAPRSSALLSLLRAPDPGVTVAELLSPDLVLSTGFASASRW